ncbi:MAG: hypothetical protein ACXW5U_16370 [Thermoanaerobaculia bacterium]
MKKTKKSKKRPSGRTTTPVRPAASREPATPAAVDKGTDAPVTSTPNFKAGKDL